PAGDVLGTDGTTLLVHEGDGQGYLARGLDVRTGSEQWRVDVGSGSWLTVVDGHAFITGTSGITLLRPCDGGPRPAGGAPGRRPRARPRSPCGPVVGAARPSEARPG